MQTTYQSEINGLVPALRAAKNNDVNEINYLSSIGVDLSQGDYDRRTPLHIAVRSGSFEVVKLLISLGARIDALDRWGSTPLNYAVYNVDMFNLLLSMGAHKGFQQP